MLHAIDALAPSRAALPSEIGTQQEKHPIYNGRPGNLFGPPIAIYHEVFAKLKDDLANADAIQVDECELRTTQALFTASAAFYDNEKDRVKKTKELWQTLLRASINSVVLDGNISITDGAVTCEIGIGLNALLSILEWKKEIGSHGDPAYQGACSYRKFVSQDKVSLCVFGRCTRSHDALQAAKLRASTCSPCLIIAVKGDYFCVLGAVFVDIVILEAFTEWICLGGRSSGQLVKVAQILKATANALSGLEHYYRNVTLTEEIDAKVHLPNPAVIEGSSPPPALRYVDRLLLSAKDIHRPLYIAKMGDRDVVVKFPCRYNKEAHEILAAQELAPKLHFCGRIMGGLWMVVMDRIKDADENDFSVDALPVGAYEDVERAIRLLHEKGFVFGDLRRPNIVVVSRGVEAGTASSETPRMPREARSQKRSLIRSGATAESRQEGALLIDFDWCGKESEEAKYPATLNDTGEIKWAKGVKRLGLMKKDHDKQLLRLFKRRVATNSGSVQ